MTSLCIHPRDCILRWIRHIDRTRYRESITKCTCLPSKFQHCRLYCEIISPANWQRFARELLFAYQFQVYEIRPSASEVSIGVCKRLERRIEDAAFHQPDIPNERQHATSSFIARNALHELTLFRDGRRKEKTRLCPSAVSSEITRKSRGNEISLRNVK